MGFAELIATIHALPKERQAEVFDFVEFLARRCGTATGQSLPHGQWTDAEFAELSMQQALRGMEDEAVAYTRDDLKERWQ